MSDRIPVGTYRASVYDNHHRQYSEQDIEVWVTPAGLIFVGEDGNNVLNFDLDTAHNMMPELEMAMFDE